MKSPWKNIRLAAVLFLLSFALVSCGDADEYDNSPGVGGALAISPAGMTLSVTAKWFPWTYPGGDTFNFYASGGTPPYYWYQANNELGILTPTQERDDGIYRILKYTTLPITAGGKGKFENTITLVDQKGSVSTMKITVDFAEEASSTT